MYTPTGAGLGSRLLPFIAHCFPGYLQAAVPCRTRLAAANDVTMEAYYYGHQSIVAARRRIYSYVTSHTILLMIKNL